MQKQSCTSRSACARFHQASFACTLLPNVDICIIKGKRLGPVLMCTEPIKDRQFQCIYNVLLSSLVRFHQASFTCTLLPIVDICIIKGEWLNPVLLCIEPNKR